MLFKINLTTHPPQHAQPKHRETAQLSVIILV